MDFLDGTGANPQDRGASLLFGEFFPKNCMKMKEIGPGAPHPLGSANGYMCEKKTFSLSFEL